MKQVKKVLAAAMSLAMVFASSVFVSAGTPAASMTQTLNKEAKTLTVTVKAPGSDISTYDYGIAFDKSKLTSTGVEFNKDLSYSMTDSTVSAEGNYVAAVGVSSEDTYEVPKDTTVVTFTFDVADVDAIGNISLVSDISEATIGADGTVEAVGEGNEPAQTINVDDKVKAGEVTIIEPAASEEPVASEAAADNNNTDNNNTDNNNADNTNAGSTTTDTTTTVTSAAPAASATPTASAAAKTSTSSTKSHQTGDTASVVVPVVAIVAAAAAVAVVSKKRVEE